MTIDPGETKDKKAEKKNSLFLSRTLASITM